MLKQKIFFIAGLICLLWLPVGVIHNLVLERAELHQQVQQQIADSSANAQLISGPLLIIELEQQRLTTQGQSLTEKQYRLLPASTLTLHSEAAVEQRSRGLYRARIYQSEHRLNAEFPPLPAELQQLLNTPAVSPAAAVLAAQHSQRITAAWLSMAVSDSRGFTRLPQLTLNGSSQPVQTGSQFAALPEGFHLPLTPAQLQQPLQVELNWSLQGSSSLSLLPAARSSQWQLTSNWPDPAFSGRYLPVQREISAQGFTAKWQSSELSNPAVQELQHCFRQSECPALRNNVFQVSLVEAVNPYQQAERAIKYAILVIVLSFSWFYLLELLQAAQVRLHPMHYLLVGLTLVMFYLLLLALSEISGFLLAYWAASAACALLLMVYLQAVLQSLARSGAVSAAYLLLQALLCLILQAETFALLSGSLLLFATLAALMYGTRHLNWQRVWQPADADE